MPIFARTHADTQPQAQDLEVGTLANQDKSGEEEKTLKCDI